MELAVLIGGKIAGRLNLRGAESSFEYEPSYIHRDGPPLSVQFPLAGGGAGGEKLRWWLQGLLPDDPGTIRGLRREYNLSAPDYLWLLGTPMGVDCAGAVQFCPPGHAEALVSQEGGHTSISEVEIADWLNRIRSDPARRAFRSVQADSGFSLAGVQPKVAVRRSPDGGWAVPWGAVPTTHIVKATRAEAFPHEAVIEHLVMETAARIGLAAARTLVDVYDGVEVIVVERFDRPAGGSIRIHQEDLCQALGYRPDRKYQYEDGPAPEDAAGLLRRADPASAEANVKRFRDGLLFQWLVANIDGHAKNYSILLPGAGAAHLAPLYDASSWLPYRKGEPIHFYRMAMKVGEDYPIASADQPAAMRYTAQRLGLGSRSTAERAVELAQAIPVALEQAIEALPQGMSVLACVGVLRTELADRASFCRSVADAAAQEARGAR